ncbi:DHH family phosphoesterase [Mycoplasmopsis felis]|uniref:DHH family phosphoesterase n=1 Tax=Mycoplasmopsis felis TaxID=33923 RepID=UPI002AF6CCDE|nr:DHH family phosphoesterase [Mycoplasmopsis felis]WQQ01477.1 DHH family phosphoesterase [Mycoplasmopsis felis]
MNSKQKFWTFIFSGVVLFILLLTSLIVFLKIEYNFYLYLLLIWGIFLLLILITFILYFGVINFSNSRELVKKSFNNLIEEVISNNHLGLIIYDNEFQIIWTSKLIKNSFSNYLIGTKISDFFKYYGCDISNFHKYVDINFTKDNQIFQAQFLPIQNTVVIKDITSENIIKREVKDLKPVVGELEIDNYNLYQSILSEEQLFMINKVVIDVLNECVNKYNIIYRQYTNGKFILFLDEKTLEKFKKTKFNIFIEINKLIENSDINKLSLSLGFATGWTSLKEKLEEAKKALIHSQSRGGDQVTIFYNHSQPIYYGSHTELISDNNRTKIKAITEILINKLSSDNIENVIIYGHKNADLDALGSACGIYEIALAYNKKPYLCMNTFDSTTNLLIQKKEFKDYKFINPKYVDGLINERTLVVMVDNSDILRSDYSDGLLNVQRNNIFVFDHHRQGKIIDFAPKSNIYIETTCSSASEIITEIYMFLTHKIYLKPFIAQLLLNGIYLDTSQFSRITSKRTFDACALLESKGASISVSTDLLKIDNDTAIKVSKLLENLTEVKTGYYLAYSDQEYSNDVISIASNEVLRVKGRIASFVVGKLEKSNLYKLSARGLDANVQIICEAVGGGGHFSAAAAETNEDLDTFIDNIKYAINTIEKR